MTAPAPPSPPVAAPPAAPPGSRTVRLTAAVALVGVLVAVVALGLALRPLETPTQDCGTALTYLLDGRIDELVDPEDPPAGVTRAEAQANNREPCQERAAARALPAGAALVGGTLVAVVAVGIEFVVRLRLAGAHRRQQWLGPPSAGDPAG
ncbi:MAG TPA: hypothetical protein VHK88_01880 [Aquihabitans sp.]|jgi:hypothetical protein|nr:hypothetical protein [Aquihabitans sp.]